MYLTIVGLFCTSAYHRSTVYSWLSYIYFLHLIIISLVFTSFYRSFVRSSLHFSADREHINATLKFYPNNDLLKWWATTILIFLINSLQMLFKQPMYTHYTSQSWKQIVIKRLHWVLRPFSSSAARLQAQWHCHSGVSRLCSILKINIRIA